MQCYFNTFKNVCRIIGRCFCSQIAKILPNYWKFGAYLFTYFDVTRASATHNTRKRDAKIRVHEIKMSMAMLFFSGLKKASVSYFMSMKRLLLIIPFTCSFGAGSFMRGQAAAHVFFSADKQ